jgi:hypothetical protein
LGSNSEALERLVVEMYARELSTRDVEACFNDETWSTLSTISRKEGWIVEHNPLHDLLGQPTIILGHLLLL